MWLQSISSTTYLLLMVLLPLKLNLGLLIFSWFIKQKFQPDNCFWKKNCLKYLRFSILVWLTKFYAPFWTPYLNNTLKNHSIGQYWSKLNYWGEGVGISWYNMLLSCIHSLWSWLLIISSITTGFLQNFQMNMIHLFW